MSLEKRKSPRKTADEVLEITDHLTGITLGKVVNISTEGLMLLSNEPFSTGSIYQLDLQVPQPLDGCSLIPFGAEVVWSMPAVSPIRWPRS